MNLRNLLKTDYELIDFGAGRKLERFAAFVVDRPCVIAEQIEPREPSTRWNDAQLRFTLGNESTGTWHYSPEVAADLANWHVCFGEVCLRLKLSPVGHLGVFPEQASNWTWLSGLAPTFADQWVLNLFAYTGGSSIATAQAGARVVHVDAAKNMVNLARENALFSNQANAPIRWIVDDAMKFAAREIRRERKYCGIILDPPSYGHGINNESWQIDRDLPALLEMSRKLLDQERGFMLLTCHTPGYDCDRLIDLGMEKVFAPLALAPTIWAEDMFLFSQAHNRLPSGVSVRFTWEPN
ncbi:MAG TPA: class I SAM-dependent methyltransferase [Pirellulaceae bacterium]|nr:class I SAM-dependent methyltransferase [Pirellulaceae bacterium]HMO92022.1 class I SAM-dependent methyltransferase [Pirellulaceae bacterium]HMP68821.1 class I SAM-dependent methyltransferase [Pirellulaceae bacterium]